MKKRGAYTLGTRLGAGASGEVWLAADSDSGSAAVVKISGRDPDSRASIGREAGILRRLSHPAIPKLLEEGDGYIAMEFAAGAPLSRAGFGPAAAAAACAGIARALAHAHERGIIHGDVKPEHIVAREDGRAVLVDFSHAGSTADGQAPGRGTPGFMAPENLRGLVCDERSDVYSLGASLYFALAGVPPYPSAAAGDEAAMMEHGLPRSPAELNPAIDPGLAGIAMKALSPDPAGRYPGAADFAEALEEWIGSHDPDPAAPGRFVGRSRELERAIGVGLRALAGARTALAICGAKGVGKSRFLEELRSALGQGRRCSPVAACRGLGSAEAEEEIAGTAAMAEGEGGATALFADGLADPGALFRALGRLGGAMPAFAAAAVESEPGAAGLPEGWALERMELLPLRPKDIESVLRSMAREGSFTAEDLMTAAAVSSGLPAIAVGIAEAALRQAARTGGGVRIVLPCEAGESGSRAFAARVGRLDRAERAVAEAAAVLGEAATEESVALVLGLPPRRVRPAADKLRGASVLVPGSEALTLSVLGAGKRIEEALAPVRREELHAAAAKALSRVPGLGQSAAAHLLRAGKVAEALAMLADGGAGRADPDVEDALRSAAASAGGPQEEARVNAALGRMLSAAGRHVEAEECMRSALSRGALAGGEREELETAAAETCLAAEDFEAALALLSRASARPGPGTARALARAGALRGLARFEEARDELGAALVSGSLNPARAAACHFLLGRVGLDLGEAGKAESNLSKARDLAAAAGDTALEVRSLVALGLCRIDLADFQAAGGRFLIAGELNLRGNSGLGAEIDLASGLMHAMTGDMDKGMSLLSRALTGSRRRSRASRGRALSAIGKAYSAAGALRKAEKYLSAAGEALRSAGAEADALSASVRLALVLLRQRKTAESRALLGTFRPRGEPLFKAAEGLIECEALLAGGDAGGAAAGARRCSDALPSHVPAPQLRGRLALTEARGRMRTGGFEAAREAFGRASSLLRAFPPHALEAAADLASDAADSPALDEGARRWALEELDAARRRLAAPADEVLALRAARAEEGLSAAQAVRKADAPHAPAAPPAPPAAAPLDREKRLLILQSMTRRINQERDFARIPEMILDTALNAIGAQRGFILGGEGGFSVLTARNMEGGRIRNPEGEISFSIARQVVETGLPVMTEDATADGRFMDNLSVRNLSLKSVLCVPLPGASGVIGAVYAEDRQRAKAFAEDDLWFMSMFAEHAAVALENGRLRSEIERRGRDLDRLNAELAEKVARQAESIADLEIRVRAAGAEGGGRFPGIVGAGPAMQKVYALMERIAASEAPVLIVGRSGTGKELVARGIHSSGRRKDRIFAAENCAALTETLLESELFGHEKGAFTGAIETSKGLFEIADGGTLFLDEVSDMSPGLQSKLLRVLQEGEIRRVGGKAAIRVDVRAISATNRDPEELVKSGTFREDLFYRLNVLKIELPDLKDRREDIPLLVRHFLDRISKDGERRELTREALDLLVSWDWPGNVRELQNEVLRAAALGGRVIGVLDLSPRIAEKRPAAEERGGLDLGERVKALETELIREALSRCGGNKSKAAQTLGLSRFGLQKKMERFGIQ